MSQSQVHSLIKALDINIEKKLAQQLEKRDVEFTGSQVQVINYLLEHQNQVIHQKDLETIFNLSRPTINGIVKRLRLKGALILEADPNDKRLKQLKLSSQVIQDANQHQKEFDNDLNELEKDLFKGFSKSEIKQFKKSLERCLNNIK